MVVIPAGAFEMGAPESELGGNEDERPAHRVRVQSFALSETEITFAQWFACVEDGGCRRYRPAEFVRGQEQHPVINISWDLARDYTQWLSAKTGERYRLPTEAEWEYAARAGSQSAFPWGESADRAKANYGDEICCSGRAEGADRWIELAAVGSFPANAYGLHDMHGNAWEWVGDCYYPNYVGAPADGAARTEPNCAVRILRGGSWLYPPSVMRSAARRTHAAAVTTGSLSFRVARDLT